MLIDPVPLVAEVHRPRLLLHARGLGSGGVISDGVIIGGRISGLLLLVLGNVVSGLLHLVEVLLELGGAHACHLVRAIGAQQPVCQRVLVLMKVHLELGVEALRPPYEILVILVGRAGLRLLLGLLVVVRLVLLLLVYLLKARVVIRRRLGGGRGLPSLLLSLIPGVAMTRSAGLTGSRVLLLEPLVGMMSCCHDEVTLRVRLVARLARVERCHTAPARSPEVVEPELWRAGVEALDVGFGLAGDREHGVGHLAVVFWGDF